MQREFEESKGQSFWWFQGRYFHEPNGKRNIHVVRYIAHCFDYEKKRAWTQYLQEEGV